MAAVIHTLLAFVLFLSLIVWMSRFEKLFKDYNMSLPSSTNWVMAVSRWMRSYWYVVIFPVGLLFAGNVLILYLLRTKPGSRRLGLYWYWFFAVTLLLLLAGGTVAVAIYLPYVKLAEGLSK
jgi:type II secretory pathway component PulF